jgi:hypothetical protein
MMIRLKVHVARMVGHVASTDRHVASIGWRKLIQDFDGETWRKHHLEDLGADGKIILKRILTERAWRVWTGFVLFVCKCVLYCCHRLCAVLLPPSVCCTAATGCVLYCCHRLCAVLLPPAVYCTAATVSNQLQTSISIFMWIRLGKKGRLLCKRWWNFWLRKMMGISWIPEELAAYQERLG